MGHITSDYVLLGIEIVVQKNMLRTSYVFVRLDQDRIDVKSYVNRREVMVLIRRSGKAISGRFWSQDKIWLGVEVADIEGRGAYWRIQFKGDTDLIP